MGAFKETVLLTIVPVLVITGTVGAIFSAGAAVGVYASRTYSGSYTKNEIDTGLNTLLQPIHSDLQNIKDKLFPEAMKVSKANNNCPVDLKTNKCIEPTKK